MVKNTLGSYKLLHSPRFFKNSHTLRHCSACLSFPSTRKKFNNKNGLLAGKKLSIRNKGVFVVVLQSGCQLARPGLRAEYIYDENGKI